VWKIINDNPSLRILFLSVGSSETESDDGRNAVCYLLEGPYTDCTTRSGVLLIKILHKNVQYYDLLYRCKAGCEQHMTLQ